MLYNKFIIIANKNGINLPDEYVCLQASGEEILKRNKSRKIERGQELSENDWIEEKLINKQIEFFKKLCIPKNEHKIHLIDTTDMTKKDVLENVCDLLKLKTKEMEKEYD